MGAIGEVVDDGFINSNGIALLVAGTFGYVELLDDGLVAKSPWPAENGMLRDYFQHQPRSGQINNSQLYSWILAMAEGLAMLHT